MSDPFSAFLWRLQRVYGMFLELRTAVHHLRSYIDVDMASYGSDGEVVRPASFHLICYLRQKQVRAYTWTGNSQLAFQAVAHAESELARITASFRSLTSAAWKVELDIHNLKVALDICNNFPTPTYGQVVAHDTVFDTLHQRWGDIVLVYCHIKESVAGIPEMISLWVPPAPELEMGERVTPHMLE